MGRDDDVLSRAPDAPLMGASGLGFHELWKLLLRRKWLLVGSMVAGAGIGVVAATQMQPLYTSVAKVMIDPRQEHLLNDVASVMSSMLPDLATVQSEVEVVQSRNLARRVIEQTGLHLTEEFNPPPKPPGPVSGLLKSLLGADTEAAADTASGPASADMSAVTDNFLARLLVAPVNQSRVIEISFTSADPVLAARVANSVAGAYTLQQMQAKFDVTQKATDWLSARLGTLKTEAEAAERAVEEFRTKAGLVQGQQGQGSLLVNEQASELTTRYVIARTEYQTAQGKLEAIESAVRRGGPSAVFNFADSPYLDQLRIQETELQRRLGEVSEGLGPKHPTVINLKSEIASVERRIAREANDAVARARNAADVARKSMEAIQISLDALKKDVGSLKEKEVQLRALEQEAQASRAIYDAFLNRFKQTEQMDFLRPESWIVSEAEVPLHPSFPTNLPFGSLGLVLGLGIGLVLMFLFEMLEAGIRSSEELERDLGLPSLGLVPHTRGRGPGGVGLQIMIDRNPNSAFAEAHKSLLTSVLLARPAGTNANTLLFTSALPGEGKTTSVAALARTAVRNGYRVAVVDADLRRSHLSRLFSQIRGPGLAEFLQGDAGMDEVIRQTDEGMDIVAAGQARTDVQQLLFSPRLKDILGQLRLRYDMVLIDSPPVLPLSDARILATLTDGCIHVVRWRRTRTRAAMHAVKELREAGARLLGAVITQVDTRQHAHLTHGDADKYSKSCAPYYSR